MSLALTVPDLAAAALLAGGSLAVIAFGVGRWVPKVQVDPLRREIRVRPAMRTFPQAANGRATRVDRGGPITVAFERMRALRLHAPEGRPQLLTLLLTDGAELPIWAPWGRGAKGDIEPLRMQLPPDLPLVGPAEMPGPREIPPPWVRWPGVPPEWGGFRQGYGEAWWLLHFQPFWDRLYPTQRADWLDRWHAPPAWRERLGTATGTSGIQPPPP